MAFTGPAVDIDDVVQRLNHFAAKQGEPNRWNRWNVAAFLKAGGVDFVQRAPRCKRYVMLSDLRRQFPKFWDSLLDAEALEHAQDEVEAEAR